MRLHIIAGFLVHIPAYDYVVRIESSYNKIVVIFGNVFVSLKLEENNPLVEDPVENAVQE